MGNHTTIGHRQRRVLLHIFKYNNMKTDSFCQVEKILLRYSLLSDLNRFLSIYLEPTLFRSGLFLHPYNSTIRQLDNRKQTFIEILWNILFLQTIYFVYFKVDLVSTYHYETRRILFTLNPYLDWIPDGRSENIPGRAPPEINVF